jgi:hypothetical protein
VGAGTPPEWTAVDIFRDLAFGLARAQATAIRLKKLTEICKFESYSEEPYFALREEWRGLLAFPPEAP